MKQRKIDSMKEMLTGFTKEEQTTSCLTASTTRSTLSIHPSLRIKFVMCEQDAQNSSTMSHFGRHVPRFVKPIKRDACGGG
jgi:hypothetical protein